MAPIATYVFLDLGTTDKEPKTAEITELCMLAVNRQDLLDTPRSSKPVTPRVQQKLLQCYKPNSKIGYTASYSGNGGFTDKILEDECPFNMTSFCVIDNFVKTLQEPVCLFAHFGHHFDFPILKRYLEKLPANFSTARILCADTHQTFYDLYHRKIKENLTGNTSGCSGGLAGENTLPMKSLNENTPRKESLYPSLGSRPKKEGAKRVYPWGPKTNMPLEKYILVEVYERVFEQKPADAHKAEVDCVLMLELAVNLGQEFVDWADNDNNCLSFPEGK